MSLEQILRQEIFAFCLLSPTLILTQAERAGAGQVSALNLHTIATRRDPTGKHQNYISTSVGFELPLTPLESSCILTIYSTKPPLDVPPFPPTSSTSRADLPLGPFRIGGTARPSSLPYSSLGLIQLIWSVRLYTYSREVNIKHRFSVIIDPVATFLRRDWAKGGFDTTTNRVPFNIWGRPGLCGDGTTMSKRALFFIKEIDTHDQDKCAVFGGRYVRLVSPGVGLVGTGSNPAIELFDFILPRDGDGLSQTRFDPLKRTVNGKEGRFSASAPGSTPYPNGTLIRADFVELDQDHPEHHSKYRSGKRAGLDRYVDEPSYTLNPYWEDFRRMNRPARFVRRELSGSAGVGILQGTRAEVLIDEERLVIVLVSSAGSIYLAHDTNS